MDKPIHKIAKIANLKLTHPVIRLLQQSGYDTYSAIVALQDEAEIERLVAYATAKNFVFLPGYKPTLISIAKKCAAMDEGSFQSESIVWYDKDDTLIIAHKYILWSNFHFNKL